MADARRELAALERGRHEAQATELAGVREAIGERKVEAVKRAESEDITREVIGRLTQPSAAQAAARLAEVILNQRRD
ncbi:hypothetical protein E4O92_07390 [Massilia horti]|uniref:Uncharacterized protein n=2 Tax=Massilia horti TaxID=2562153 RepID=A0A4Y9T1P5_9BURK|nr:hypothetical protein E4O92_07390 [Massilia horti]